MWSVFNIGALGGILESSMGALALYRKLKPEGIILIDVQGNKMYVNTLHYRPGFHSVECLTPEVSRPEVFTGELGHNLNYQKSINVLYHYYTKHLLLADKQDSKRIYALGRKRGGI